MIGSRHPMEDMKAAVLQNSRFRDEALHYALSNKSPENWRSAWLLFHCLKDVQEFLQEHCKELITALINKEGGHQRELIKIIFELQIPEDMEGPLYDTCFDIWCDLSRQPSVRIKSLEMLFRIVQRHPELAAELESALDEHFLESLSPGIQSQCRKIRQKVLSING